MHTASVDAFIAQKAACLLPGNLQRYVAQVYGYTHATM